MRLHAAQKNFRKDFNELLLQRESIKVIHSTEKLELANVANRHA